MTAISELKQRARANAHDITDPSTSLTGKDAAERMIYRKVISVPLEGETAATDYTLLACEVPASEFPNGAEVKAIEFRSSAAVTESTSVYNTYTFNSVDSAGVTPLTAATMTTDTIANAGIGTTIAFKKYAATLSSTLANRVIPSGGALTCVRTHASTGTAVPKGSKFTVILEAL